MQVRDAFLAKAQQSLTTLAVPESNVGRAYQAQQHKAMVRGRSVVACRAKHGL